jgi:uncharacterized membrane protein YdbT with pleckstrin-like domain
MSYIDRSLLEGERVVYRTRLHWLMVIGPVFITAIVTAPIVWFLWMGTWSNYTWIPLAIWLVVLAAAVIKRQSSDFAVTNKRVMMKVGVFSSRSVELLLNKIEAIAVNQSFVGRMFGYGDIEVTGSGGTKEEFANIQAPLDFRRAVQSVTDAQTRPTPSKIVAHPDSG